MRWSALVLVAAPLAAHAQSAPPAVAGPDQTAQGDVAVTIYNNDLALIEDRRVLALPAGRTRQEFADVSAAIRPETVTLSGAGLGVVEQNFDFDLLTPEKLMDKAVGQTVTLVRDSKSESARVLANNNGTVVQIGDHIEVLDGTKTRVIFPSIPANLRARPTLSVTLDSDSAGSRPVTLNYLSTGLSWKADYVALFDEKAGKIDVQGWITLNNTSGTTFTNANTMLVAGAVGVQANGGDRPQAITPGTQTAARERLGDFYLYPLAQRTTIANAQQKQVSFLDVSGAAAAKVYVYYNNWMGASRDPVSAETRLRFSSSRDGGLGDALPAGTVRIYMRDARGQPQFIGEAMIPHTPMGSRLELGTGEAFDVKVQATVDKREALSGDKWRTAMRYHFTNARPQDVVVEFVQSGLDNGWNDTKVESASQPGERLDSDRMQWKVTVPANGETTVTAVYVTRY